jgi:hypothetical protein
MLYQSNLYMLAALTAVKTSILKAGAAGFKIKLAQGPTFAPNPNSVPGDFTEADYTGYAAVTLTTMSANSQTGNSFESTSTTVAGFAPSGTAVTNSILGYWVESDGGDLLAYEVFPAPIPMQTTLDSIQIVPRWQIQPAQWPNSVLP